MLYFFWTYAGEKSIVKKFAILSSVMVNFIVGNERNKERKSGVKEEKKTPKWKYKSIIDSYTVRTSTYKLHESISNTRYAYFKKLYVFYTQIREIWQKPSEMVGEFFLSPKTMKKNASRLSKRFTFNVAAKNVEIVTKKELEWIRRERGRDSQTYKEKTKRKFLTNRNNINVWFIPSGEYICTGTFITFSIKRNNKSTKLAKYSTVQSIFGNFYSAKLREKTYKWLLSWGFRHPTSIKYD